MIEAATRNLDRFLAVALASIGHAMDQGGNLRHHSSPMLWDLTVARHRQQP
jgi:hypothetical protein